MSGLPQRPADDATPEARAAAVRLLVLDVDGVLTDGRQYFGADGEAVKAFDVRDGHGVKLLREAGIEVAILSARRSPIVDRRAAELGIAHVVQGAADKGLCIGLFVVTLSKLFLTFVIAVGPIFVLCLAWRPTARFFDSWLSMLLNSVVLTWFAFFALGLSTFIGNQMFVAIQSGGGFLGGTFNVLGEATRYCVLMILMAIICFQAPSLASALTGGAAVQQGVQMIQNAMMVSGLRSASASRGASAASNAGGVIRAGAGMPQAIGRAAGAASSAGNRFAGSMATGAAAMARQGYATARTAAYRLAALRGRS